MFCLAPSFTCGVGLEAELGLGMVPGVDIAARTFA